MKHNYPVQFTADSVILLKGGRRFIASSSHINFHKIRDYIRAGRYNNIERLFEVKSSLEKIYNITIKDNSQIFYKDAPLHPVMAEKIMYFLRNGLPHRALIKFFNNLMENTSQTARDTLYDYLTQQKLPITDDGQFIGVKAIQRDWTDIHSGKVCNKVGKTVQMKREDVNSNPSECGHVGLHLGSAEYVRQYGKGDSSRYILVQVNPKDVVVVPREGTYQKIRVCKYKVIAEIKREDLDFTSDYAPKNKQYEARKNHGPKRDKNGRFAAK